MLRQPHDGDNAMTRELRDGHENVLGIQVPTTERGGGDMTDNSHRSQWIHGNHNANYCRVRMLSISMNGLALILIPLMILSLFIILNIWIAILYERACRESGVKLEILHSIKKGYILSGYIRVLNEALLGALTELPDDIRINHILREIHHLNEVYEELLENIQRLTLFITGIEEKIHIQDHL